MKFDAYALLAGIRTDSPADATRATRAIPDDQYSTCSANSTAPPSRSETQVPTQKAAATPSLVSEDPFRCGRAFTGDPKTWTGRIVSLDAWRRLTDWEKYGPDGRLWNGITKKWERNGSAE